MAASDRLKASAIAYVAEGGPNCSLPPDDLSWRLTLIGHVALNVESLCRCQKLVLRRSPSATLME